MTPLPIEYCEDCSWHIDDEDGHYCTKEQKYIPYEDFEEGIIPKWCKLEEE